MTDGTTPADGTSSAGWSPRTAEPARGGARRTADTAWTGSSARWWRSLRGRATLASTALTLVLSTAMAVTVWLGVSHYLLVQREETTLVQVTANADQVQRGLRAEGLTPPQLLAQLPRENGSVSLLADGDQWYTTSLRYGRDTLPAGLHETVVDGEASRQRISVGDRTVLAVGVPLAGLEQAYFEVFTLQELDRTYRALSASLAAAALTLPLLALLLSWWVTRPALRPLDRLTSAATAIAAGDLGTRVDPRDDPQLFGLARSVNATARALERRMRSDARFAADVSHELRSPLTTIVNAVHLVDAHRDRLPADGREGLDLLHAEVDRFQRLVQDLLELARADAGDADLDLEDLLLAELVRRTLPALLRDRLRVDPGAAGTLVRVDKRCLERVVANLVDNAEEHGGGLAAITVSADPGAERQQPTAHVTVDDAGPGIDVADRERVFERFTRATGSARTTGSGTGLGLAIAQRHAHLLGGRVSVTGSPQGGARLVLELPLPVDEEVTTGQTLPAGPPGSRGRRGTRRRVPAVVDRLLRRGRSPGGAHG